MATARTGLGPLMITVFACLLAGVGLAYLLSSPTFGGSGNEQLSLEARQRIERQELSRERMRLEKIYGGRESIEGTTLLGATTSTRIRNAVARVDVPEVKAEAGEAWIVGTVTDQQGMPVRGVTIRANRITDSQKTSWRTEPGDTPAQFATLEEALADSAEDWAWDQAHVRVGWSDDQGVYRLDGLAPGEYYLSAGKKDWTIRAEGTSRVTTDATVPFQATPVCMLTLDVRLPDGTAPEEAQVVQTMDGHEHDMTWTPEQPTLRFGQSNLSLKVFSGIYEGHFYQARRAADFASEQLVYDFDLEPNPTRVVHLLPSNGVIGTVAWGEGATEEDSALVGLKRIQDTASFDPSFAFDQDLEDRTHKGKFTFSGLVPGTYVVAMLEDIGLYDQAIPGAFQVVQVQDSVVSVALKVVPDLSGDYLEVTCIDQRGLPVMLQGIGYSLDSPSSHRSGGTEYSELNPGVYNIEIDSLEGLEYDNWPNDKTLSLKLTSKEHGTLTTHVSPGQRFLQATFADPVSLTVTVLAYEDNPRKEAMTIDAHMVKSSGGGPPFPGMNFGGPRLNAKGVAVLPNLAPGTWRVTLKTEHFEMDSVEVHLAGHDQAVQLQSQELHSLQVSAPGLDESAMIQLASSPKGTSAFPPTAQLNGDLRCRFRDLPTGTYYVSEWGGPRDLAPMEVQVPGPEVVLEQFPFNVLKVEIYAASGLFFDAGLRDGDIIQKVNGKTASEEFPASAMYFELTHSAPELELLRDGSVITLTLPQLERDGGPRVEIGGKIYPAYVS